MLHFGYAGASLGVVRRLRVAVQGCVWVGGGVEGWRGGVRPNGGPAAHGLVPSCDPSFAGEGWGVYQSMQSLRMGKVAFREGGLRGWV